MKHRLKRQLLLVATVVTTSLAFAQAPNNTGTYYKSANGKKGQALKTALFKIINNPQVTSYSGLLSAYRTTDVRDDGKVWDMYSNITNYDFTNNSGNSSEGSGYNREHSIPQSWFKDGPMKSDVAHVIPTDAYVNNRRGSYPYGEVGTETYHSANGFSKVGHARAGLGYSGLVFEPNDEYKGDFARIYFYMATCYENLISSWASNGTASSVLAGNSYPVFKPWYIDMLLRWAAEDPVSAKEVKRNAAIQSVQGNRNPFVDYPGLEQYIWGSKQDVGFNYEAYESGIEPPDPDDENNKPTPVEGQKQFEKVTSTAQLEVGTEYLIVYEAGLLGMAANSSNGKYRLGAAVTISNNVITTKVDEAGAPHQLTLGGNAGAYTFYDNFTKSYLSVNEDGNVLNSTQDAATASQKWTVTISGDDAKIVNNQYNTREIRYNTASNAMRFAAYKGSQQVVALYKLIPQDENAVWRPQTDGSMWVNVYNICGQKVRNHVHKSSALYGLPRGIYVVEGRKYVIE